MIGRFSALAVSNIANIKSYYQGKMYQYLMYKDGEQIKIDLLNTLDTEYENGLEVSVIVTNWTSSISNIIKGLTQLAYFEQIYVDCSIDSLSDFIKRFNERQIHEFNTFKVCSLRELADTYYLMGNVLYKKPDTNYLSPNIAITCNIGDVAVTPNRESLRYDMKTIQYLDEREKQVKQEILDLAQNTFVKDYNTVSEYVEALRLSVLRLQLWRFDDYIIWDNIKKQDICLDSCTIQGYTVPNDITLIQLYDVIMNNCVLKSFIAHDYAPKTFYTPHDVALKLLFKSKVKYVDKPLSINAKRYYRENYSESCIFLKKHNVKNIFRTISNTIRRYLIHNPELYDKYFIRLIYEEIKKRFMSFGSYGNEDIPKEWLDSIKVTKVKDVKKKEIVYHRLQLDCLHSRTIDTKITSKIGYLKDILDRDYTIVYDELNSKVLRFIFKLWKMCQAHERVVFIEVAKNYSSELKNIKKLTPINVFIQNNGFLKKLFTVQYIRNNFPNLPFDDVIIKRKKTDYSIEFDKERWDETLTNLPLFRPFYELYCNKGWLDYDRIETVSNPNIQVLNQLYVTHRFFYTSVENMLIVSMFIYKNNISIGGIINKSTAYKYINEHL